MKHVIYSLNPPIDHGHCALEDLKIATKTLKNNKSIDPNGMIIELFKPKIVGKDLKKGSS